MKPLTSLILVAAEKRSPAITETDLQFTKKGLRLFNAKKFLEKSFLKS